MALTRINNNVSAINANRNLNLTSSRLSDSITRLSSGLRINRAADDAAGLTISENLRSQISGINQAIDNSSSAVNVVDTAEGALNETTTLLQRVRTLAVQAANTGTNDSTALQAIQDEIATSISEITRIGNDTQFGSRKLINGENANTASLQSAGTGISLATSPTASNLSTGTRYLTVSQTVAGSETLTNGTDGANNSGATALTGSTFDSGTYDVVVSNVVAGGRSVVSTSGSITSSASITLNNGAGGNNSQISNFSASTLSAGTHTVAVSNFTSADYRTVTTNNSMTSNGSTIITDPNTSLQGLYVDTSNSLAVSDVLGVHVFTSDGSEYQIQFAANSHTIQEVVDDFNTYLVSKGSSDTLAYNGTTGQFEFTAGVTGSNTLSLDVFGGSTGDFHHMGSIVTVEGGPSADISIDGGTAVSVYEGETGVTATSGSGGSITFDVGSGLSNGTDNLVVTTGGVPASTASLLGLTVGSTVLAAGNNLTFYVTDSQGNEFGYGFDLDSSGTHTIDTVLSNIQIALSGSDTVSWDATNGQFVITAGGSGSSNMSISLVVSNLGSTLETLANEVDVSSGGSATMTVGGGASQTVTAGGTYTFYGPEPSDPGETTPQITMTLGGTLTAGTDTLTIVADEYQGSLEGGASVSFQNGDEKVQFLSGTAAGYDAGESITLDFDEVIDLDGGSSRTFLISAVNNALSFQVGANEGQQVSVQFGDMRATALGFVGQTQTNGNSMTVDGIDVTTLTGANEALAIIDEALNQVESQRSALGAFTNRLESTISNLGVTSENLTSSESLIRDVDMAEETTTYTKNNILLQAGTSILAQANSAPQQILSLLNNL